MEILSLSADSFRNLAPGRLEFHPRLNLIVGANGQGKTNLLEAVTLLCGRSSFRTNDLAAVRRHGAPRCTLTARVKSAARDEVVYGLTLADGLREHTANGRKISRLSAAGQLPALVLGAADLARLSGPPSDRRKAADRAAASRDPQHARQLARYEAARAAKSRLLALKGFDLDELAVYEETLAEAGGHVAAARRAALHALEPELRRHAAALGSPYTDLALRIASDLPAEGNPFLFAAELREQMARRKSEERRAGRCLVGPHRDDVLLLAGGRPVAECVSSGESRTLVLAWTLAEHALLASASGEIPLLGFDDFDSEWDPGVLGLFADTLPENVQLFLTSARPDAVRGLPFPQGTLFRMHGGKLAREGILGGGRSAAAAAGGAS